MPSKAEFYRQMAEQVSTRLVGSWQEWTAFLITASRLYKYPFHEQMMDLCPAPGRHRLCRVRSVERENGPVCAARFQGYRPGGRFR